MYSFLRSHDLFKASKQALNIVVSKKIFLYCRMPISAVFCSLGVMKRFKLKASNDVEVSKLKRVWGGDDFRKHLTSEHSP